MRLASVFAIVLTLGMVGSAFAQPGCDPGSKQFLVGTGSYSFGHGTQNPAVGSPLSVVGKLNKSTVQNPGRPINYDMATTSEYTFYISGVDLDQFVDNGTAVPDSFRYGAGGTIAIYYDTSADAPNSPPINPPNGTVPSAYIDGSLILVGSIDDLLVTYRDNAVVFPDSVGEIRGNVTFTGGDSLGVLVSNIWVWNATVDDATVPNGFNWRWSGELKNDCVPAGACCFCDGTCQDLTEADCDAAGGVYQGDGTDCSTASCPATGACCLPDATCAEVTAAECEAAGGIFYVCTPCEDVICTNAAQEKTWGGIKGLYR
jgi:hypothetical protein